MSLKQHRVVLIHALRESQEPSWRAFEAGWPEAQIFNLLDDSLSADLANEGALSDAIANRFLYLGRYAAEAGAAGILFTCAAFGSAIVAVQKDLPIPVLRPNEAAFEAALDSGNRIGLMVSFPPALAPLKHELEAMASDRGTEVEVIEVVAEGALAALREGELDDHDRLAAEAAKHLPPVDALILGQFSLARAAPTIAPALNCPLFTTPDAAVAKLRRLLEGN